MLNGKCHNGNVICIIDNLLNQNGHGSISFKVVPSFIPVHEFTEQNKAVTTVLTAVYTYMIKKYRKNVQNHATIMLFSSLFLSSDNMKVTENLHALTCFNINT
jgi:hypothetical protein